MCPLDELGRCELCDSLGVSTAPVVVEQLMPLAAAAAAEEGSIVLQNAFAGVGREFVRSMAGVATVLFTVRPDRWLTADFSEAL